MWLVSTKGFERLVSHWSNWSLREKTWEIMWEEVKITSPRGCTDFEGTFVTSNARASILERNSTSSWLVNSSTYTIQVTEKNFWKTWNRRSSRETLKCNSEKISKFLVSNCVVIYPLSQLCDMYQVKGWFLLNLQYHDLIAMHINRQEINTNKGRECSY